MSKLVLASFGEIGRVAVKHPIRNPGSPNWYWLRSGNEVECSLTIHAATRGLPTALENISPARWRRAMAAPRLGSSSALSVRSSLHIIGRGAADVLRFGAQGAQRGSRVGGRWLGSDFGPSVR